MTIFRKTLHRLTILTVGFVLCYMVYGALSFKTLNDVRVNGQLYQRIVQGKDLVADVLPPPEYIIESYLVALQLFSTWDKSQQDNLIERLKALKVEYDTRHEFWGKQELDSGLADLILKQSYDPAVAFYNITFSEFIPALQKQNKDAATAAMLRMNQAYEAHRQAIDQIVIITNKRVASDEKQARATIRNARNMLITLWVGGLLLVGGMAFWMARKLKADNTRLIEGTLLLEHQALHDTLTSLPNRALLGDRLQQAIISCARDNKTLALLVMDLDHFKEVNDTLGHHSGDQLLQQVALRLQNTLRRSDTVARLGGDEFAVLLLGADAEDAKKAAGMLLTALEKAFLLEGQMLDVRGSIGITLYPAHGADALTLLRRADVAMYVAKRRQSGYALYASEQDHNSQLRLTLTSELSHAIERQQLTLHYQPKVSFKTGRVVSAEALVRWQRPEHGLVAPDEFIPLAEHTGLIRPLTQWVLYEALRQCAAWRKAGIEITLAVNLSARNLLEAQFTELLASHLAAWSVPPEYLELEITESAIMSDPLRALDALTRLDAMGVGLSIDDFGTGYSSLAYLKKLPVDTLKIDKSFVMNMAQDDNDAVIVRSTIDLAHNLSLRVVAEGVEDQQTWDMLDELGCDIAQGYFLSRPLAAADFMEWLERNTVHKG